MIEWRAICTERVRAEAISVRQKALQSEWIQFFQHNRLSSSFPFPTFSDICYMEQVKRVTHCDPEREEPMRQTDVEDVVALFPLLACSWYDECKPILQEIAQVTPFRTTKTDAILSTDSPEIFVTLASTFFLCTQNKRWPCSGKSVLAYPNVLFHRCHVKGAIDDLDLSEHERTFGRLPWIPYSKNSCLIFHGVAARLACVLAEQCFPGRDGATVTKAEMDSSGMWFICNGCKSHGKQLAMKWDVVVCPRHFIQTQRPNDQYGFSDRSRLWYPLSPKSTATLDAAAAASMEMDQQAGSRASIQADRRVDCSSRWCARGACQRRHT